MSDFFSMKLHELQMHKRRTGVGRNYVDEDSRLRAREVKIEIYYYIKIIR